jgi:hypothetical protein
MISHEQPMQIRLSFLISFPLRARVNDALGKPAMAPLRPRAPGLYCSEPFETRQKRLVIYVIHSGYLFGRHTFPQGDISSSRAIHG